MKNGLDSPFKSVAKFRFLDFKTRITPYTEVDQNGIQWDEQVKKVNIFLSRFWDNSSLDGKNFL